MSKVKICKSEIRRIGAELTRYGEARNKMKFAAVVYPGWQSVTDRLTPQ